jgi:DNA polymerase III, alpha subunit
MTRHASVHAAGVVIAPKAITEYAPLYKGARDEIVTQWSMKEIERVGLLKMDFLGLSTLTLIFDAIAEIKRTTGEELDIDSVPLDDGRPTRSSRTADLRHLPVREQRHARHPAQVEAAAARRPDRAQRAYRRSAAQRHGRRLHRAQAGKTEIKYDLPALEPILADTYGVIAYQEQVMRISNVVAGFTLGKRPAAQGDGQEERRGHGQDARQVRRGRKKLGTARRKARRSST